MARIYNCKFCGQPIELDDSTRPGDNIKCRHCNVVYPLPDNYGDESFDVRRDFVSITMNTPPELPPDESPDAEPGMAKKAAYGVFVFFEKIVFFIIILFMMFGLFFSGSNSHNNAAYKANAKKKSCVANMRTLEGAAELYNMEHVIVNIPALDFNLEKDLKQQGYLKSVPICPDGGRYSLKTTYLSNTESTTEVKCSSHGKVR